ncbi:MAG: hypothetical protein K9M07_06615 [Simkaniaceae bacterium]|nr:hypothetical protein [Simkaniaceae bacterium]MCF7852895.1 hypothetical protein [Simkaniaceae bacterium]
MTTLDMNFIKTGQFIAFASGATATALLTRSEDPVSKKIFNLISLAFLSLSRHCIEASINSKNWTLFDFRLELSGRVSQAALLASFVFLKFGAINTRSLIALSTLSLLGLKHFLGPKLNMTTYTFSILSGTIFGTIVHAITYKKATENINPSP